jgi:type IV secretion system protein VirD4
MGRFSKYTRILAGMTVICAVLLFILGAVTPTYEYDARPAIMVGVLQFIFFICLVLLVISVIAHFFKRKPKVIPRKSTDHGSAEWCTQEEFIALGNTLGKEGLYLGDFYRRTKPGHLLTIAGSGSGKNACLILPNLLVNPYGSYVVTDPKGENACITARNQKRHGQRVYILDPWKIQNQIGARHGIPMSYFNPFDFIKSNPEELRDNCELVASYLIPDNPNAKDPYWDDRARSLIKTCLMHIVTDLPEDQHNFWSLYKMVRVSGENWLSLLADMKLNESYGGLISIAAEEFMGMDPNGTTIAGIRSNAQNATSIFESPQLQEAMSKSDFNPYNLADGNCTVYIVIPERYLETHSAWIRMVVGLCLKAVNSRPNRRVNFFLDEFAVLGKMKDIQKAYAFARGQNIVLWSFAQSLSQIREIYGEDGMNTLISNTEIFQAFGIKDQFTREYVSKALGEATYIKQSNNYGTTTGSSHGNSSTNTGTSTTTYGRPLLTPEEVEKFPHIITLTAGKKFWIYKIGYYQNRFEGIHWKDPRLDKENAQIIKSGKLPTDLREIFAEIADPPPRIIA